MRKGSSLKLLSLMLISLYFRQTKEDSFAVNMDLDVAQGDYMTMTNSVYYFSIFTEYVTAGTTIFIKVPTQLTIQGTSGSSISVCKEAFMDKTTLAITTYTLTSNCVYTQVLTGSTYNAITMTIGHSVSNLQLYYFYIGYIQNPSSTQYPDSFEITFSGGYPTGSQTNGLVITYVPNLIYSATLSYNYNQAGTTDTYTFKFKVTNSIPRYGYVQLTFPSPWTSSTVPQTIATMTSANIYGTSITSVTVETPITLDVYYNNLFSNTGITADSSKDITLTVTGITNPSTVTTTNSFIITTLDSDKYSIDQISTGLTVAITQPGVLTVTCTLGDYSVDASTYIQFSIVPGVKYSSKGYVEVVLPSAYMSWSTSVICSAVFGFSATTTSDYCTRVDSTTVKYSRTLSTSASSVAFYLYNIKNSLGAVTNSPIYVYFKESSGSISAQTLTACQYTTTVGTCTVTSAVRSTTVTTVGLSGAQYDLTFSCTHRINYNGKIMLVFPQEQIDYSASTQCYDGSTSTALTCIIGSSTNSAGMSTMTVSIGVQGWCIGSASTADCPAATSLKLTLKNALNPSYINSPLSNSVEIYTYTLISGTYYVTDQVTSGVYFTNSLTPGALTSMSFARTGSGLTGGTPIYTFTFTTATKLSSGAVVKITFPTGQAYYGTATTSATIGGTSKTCTTTALSTDTTQISTAIVSSACTSTTCAAATTYTVAITNFINAYSTASNTALTFTVETYVSSTNGQVDKGTITATSIQLSLSPNVFTASLTAPTTPITVGATTSYTLSITNTYNKIPASTSNGNLTIVLPSELTLSSTACTAQTTSLTLTCSAVITTRTITVTASADIAKGSTITVNLPNNVKNPPTGAPSSAFTINSYVSTDSIDSLSTLTVTADTFNDIVSPTSARSDATINAAITMTISFSTTNPIPVGSIIKFYIPKDQAVIGSAGFAVTDASGTGSVTQVTILQSYSTTYNTFAVKEWCSDDNSNSQCPATYTSKLSVTGFNNPANAKYPSYSIIIEIYTSTGYKIDQVSSNLYTIPNCNYGAMQSVTMVRSNSVVGQAATLTVTYKTATAGTLTSGDYVSILFPSEFLYYKSGSVTCTIRESTGVAASTTCTPTYVSGTMGSYIYKITGDMKCGSTITCTGGKTFEFVITGLYNPFSTKSQDGNIISTSTIIASTSEIMNVLDQTIGTDIATSVFAYTDGTITSSSLVRTVTSIDASTYIQFDITLPTRLEKNGYIEIQIPNTQFVADGSSYLYQQYSSGSYGSSKTLSVSSTSGSYIIAYVQEWCHGTANYCSDSTQVKLQIVSGLKNVGYVVSTPTNFFTITTYTSDYLYSIDTVTSLQATPPVTAATITVSSIAFSTSTVAATGVNLDITVKFGATIQSTYYILITFSTEFIRSDLGSVTCALLSGTTETTKSCTVTSSGYQISTIQISNFCTSACSSTTSYTIRIKNVVNRLYQTAFTGTMLMETRIDSSTLVSTVTYALSSVTTLSTGTLTSVSVVRSASTQGSTATFTLTWTTPGLLLDGSTVYLYLPLNQISLSSGSTVFTFTDSSGNSLAFTQTASSPTSTYYIYTLTEWKCSSPYCSSGTTFTVKINNAMNPYVQSSTYDDFKIQHYTTNSEGIFTTSSPLTATPSLTFGTISPLTITHQNYQYVNRETEYVFAFTVQSDIPVGGKIRVTFPASRVLQSTSTTLSCKLGTTTYPCTITYASTGTQIVITSVCPSAACTQPISYSLTTSGAMMNPASVPLSYSGSFYVETLSSANYIIAQGTVLNSAVTPILPEPFTDATVIRQSQYMSASTQYNIHFTLINAIDKNGMFRIVIPFDQATFSTNFPSCAQNYVLTSITCSIVIKSSTAYYLDIKQFCSTTAGCAAGKSIDIVLYDMINPSSFSANDVTSSWEIYSMNSAYEYIDGISTGLEATPDLIGLTSIIQAVALDNDIVSKDTYLRMGLVTGSDMTSSALIDIYFPDQFALDRGSTTCYVILGSNYAMTCSFTKYTSGYISMVTLNNPCPSSCSSASTYYYMIPIETRGDNYPPGGTWTIIVKYSYVDVGKGTLANTLSCIEDTITDYYITNDGCNTVDQECSLKLSFTPINYVPPSTSRGRIRIEIPSQLTPTYDICQASANWNTYGMKCSMSGYNIYVTHTKSTIVGFNITVEIKKIVNPGSTKPTDAFQIYTEWDVLNDGTYYQIDTLIDTMTYQVTDPTYLLDASVTRLGINDGRGYQTGMTTQLLFYAQLKHAMETTSTLHVTFPDAAQVKFITGSSSATCYSTDASWKIASLLLCEISTTNNTVIVRNYCQVANCAKRDKVRFKMYDDFVENYNYVVSPLNSTRDSLTITTTTSEGYYFMDTYNTSLFIKPDLRAANLTLQSPEIIRTNNVINKKVQWVINLKIQKNPVPSGGYIVMYFPQDAMLTIQNSSIDVMNYDTGANYPSYNYTLYSDGKSVKSILISNFCNTSTFCSAGQSFSIMINWIKNPIAQYKITQSIVIELRTNETYLAEQGVTQPVYKIFSQLIPVKLQNFEIRPINPVPSVITDYEVTFSGDAEFSLTDILYITFPIESKANTTTNTSRSLASYTRCTSLFNVSSKLNCTLVDTNKFMISGLFTNNNKHYSVKIKDIQNPPTSGATSGSYIEVTDIDNNTIASKSTNTRFEVYASINQTACNKVCGTCAGTTSTCTTCKVPSNYPLYKQYSCVDSCGDGYFFDENNLQCKACAHMCSNCFGPGDKQCRACASGYYLQDGQCVPFCTKTLQEDIGLRQCVNKNSSACSSNCETCSLNTSYCLSCNVNSKYPVMDRLSGKCIQQNAKLCNNSQSTRFYIDKDNLECRTCNELCKTCENSATVCTACWTEFQSKNIVNELYETCVSSCGLGTWYNGATNVCSYCNPVCLLCSGYNADQCLVCNSTPEARQLYKYEQQCVLSCPKKYYVNEVTNECIEGQATILSFSFLFMFASFAAAVLATLVSIIVTKNKNKTFDVFYAMVSSAEFVNRLVLLGNLWVKTNVFALAVCFMNLIATCAIAVFFNFLFMSPIYAHSPHFRTLYKKYTCSYQTVTALSYFGGVNLMRLLFSGFLGITALQADLNNWKFFVVPLNQMSNFTVIFTAFQIGVCVYVLMELTISDDAFVLAILGMVLNASMLILQFFKHLNVRAFLIRNG